MTSKSESAQTYTDKDVQNLSGRDAVRLRPGMYIGGKDSAALAHIVAEMIDNSVDEYMQGFCNDIWVEIAADQAVTVRDNGRGMPIGESTTADGVKMPTPQMLTTVLHSGGKFGKGSYDTSGGLHGVGLKAGNFMSERFVIDIWRDGKHYHQEFSDGSAKVGKAVVTPHKGKERGTQMSFRFDPTVFAEGTHIDAERLVNKLRDASYPAPGLTLHFSDERTGVSESYSANGIGDLVERMVADTKALLPKTVSLQRRVEIEKGDARNWTSSASSLAVEVALMPTDDMTPADRSMGFTNIIPNPDGGDHVSGTKTGLARAIKRFMTKNSLTKSPDTLESADILTGLALVVSVRMNDPLFASQHKTRLAVPEVNSLVAGMIDELITDWLDGHEKEAKVWAKNIEENRLSRLEALTTKKALRSRNNQTINTLLNKLSRENPGCPPERAEIFMVEGDSAGGSAKGARDSHYQAILPFKGKPKNVWGLKKLSDLIGHQELMTLAAALGLDYRAEFDINDLRYHKIVFLADADADGGHINLLWLGIIYQEWPQLISGGHIFVARPPLYSVTPLKGRDKNKIYVYTDGDLSKVMGSKSEDFLVNRFKGLGEMNADQLKEVAFNPETRFLQRLTVGDAQFAHEMIAGVLGDSPAWRKEYLRRSGMSADDEALVSDI